MSIETKVLTVQNYINGAWLAPKSDNYVVNKNPARINEEVGSVPLSNEEDIEAAVVAASEARKKWRSMTGAERGNVLFKVASIMEERVEAIGTRSEEHTSELQS